MDIQETEFQDKFLDWRVKKSGRRGTVWEATLWFAAILYHQNSKQIQGRQNEWAWNTTTTNAQIIQWCTNLENSEAERKYSASHSRVAQENVVYKKNKVQYICMSYL
jgi:hypothetical protein